MEYKECESCFGYCCISTADIHTPLTESDVRRISKHLCVPLDRFIADYVVMTRGRVHYHNAPDATAHIRSAGPCPFLRLGLCAINDVKPKACREEVPMGLNNTISCADWHKARLGWDILER